MRRVRYHEYGGPDVLTIEDGETPEALLASKEIAATEPPNSSPPIRSDR